MRQNKLTVNFWALAIITVFGFICYANSLLNHFVYDDLLLIQENRLLRNWGNILEIFQTQLLYGANKWSPFYRPLQNLSYLIEFQIWGLAPWGYHLTNTLLHLLNSWLVYGLILKLCSNGKAAFLAGLFFVIHPINVEAVTYISSRANLLASFFLLLSFWLYLRPSKAGSLISFIFALLAKEFVLIFPALVFLYEVCYGKKRKGKLHLKNTLWKLIPYFAVSFIYIVLRLTYLNFEPHSSTTLSTLSLLERSLGFLKAFAVYIKLLILPFPLHMERSLIVPNSIWDPLLLLSLLILALWTGILLKYRHSSHILFFSFWFFLSLFPVSNLYPINASLAEAWLYEPSFGWFALIGLLGSYLWERKRFFLSFFLVAFLFYSFLTFQQNKYWQDEYTFYTHTLKFSPMSARIHQNLATWHKKEGDYEKAVSYYAKAIRINPQFAEAYNNLGVLFISSKDYDNALPLIQKAIQLEPTNSVPYHNLGKTYLMQKKFNLSKKAFQEAIKLYPYSAESHMGLGVIFINEKNPKEAKLHLIKALRSDLQSPEFYLNLGDMFFYLNEFDFAKKAWEKTLKFDPQSEEAKKSLIRMNKVE